MDKESLIAKQQKLLQSPPLDKAAAKNLEDWLRVELTYTSNAIEGNTLTRQETALILEKDIAIGGKTLTEHLEAKNHALSLDYLYAKAQDPHFVFNEDAVLALHALVLRGIDDSNAGRYRAMPVRISGSRVILPNAAKIPALMEEFGLWLENTQLDAIDLALEAHYRLVTIHPFIDGNGRTARLLLNGILLQNHFPPLWILPEERLDYINALEKAQLGGSKEDYICVMYKALSRALDLYLDTVDNR